MDLSVLPPLGNESTERTEPRFTVRSANSPSYLLTRRPGIKKTRSLLDQKKEDDEVVGQREKNSMNTGWTNRDKNGTGKYQSRIGSFSNEREEQEISSKLDHNGTEHRLNSEIGRNTQSRNDIRGRTEWRRHNLGSRSKSLECRTKERSPVGSRRDDTLSTTTGLNSQLSFDEKRTGFETLRTSGKASGHVYVFAGRTGLQEESPVNDLGLLSRGNSFPSRIKAQSRSTETTLSLGPAGGQSILERIEKLYGSAGFGKAGDYNRIRDPTSTDSPLSLRPRSYECGTFPRRFSSGEKNSYSPKSTMWSPQKDTFSPESSFSTEGTRRPWQWKVQDRVSGEMSPGTRLADIGTRSLDRARSRNTVAAQIRSARASRGFNVSHDFPGETNGLEETSYGSKELRSLSTGEDVFELNTGNNILKPTDRKDETGFSSAASVRNKINQFEALSQKSQSLATGQQQLPRRAFSVPTQRSVDYVGVRKSGSAKEISSFRDKWEGLKEEEKVKCTGEENAPRAGRKLLLDRFISEDMVRPWRTERELNDQAVKEKKDKIPEELGQNSRFTTTLEIPLNRESTRQQNSFHIDETDFFKAASPEESGLKHLGDKNIPSSEMPPGGQKLKLTSSVGDEDETPTNTPDNSPFHSPTAKKSFPSKDPCDGDSVFTSTRTPELDSSHPPQPVSSSPYNNLPDPISHGDSGVHQKKQKQALDLNAWVSGLNSAFVVWNTGVDDEEDDDDDEDTQRDEDSPYDSDSGESSVTITSNMSQMDRKSFSLSLSDLCNFAGVEDESENDSDEWQSLGGRSASLSSDVSALSYVSVMPTEELDKLLQDVKNLGESQQDYNAVQVVVLHKEMGVGLGFSVAGGVDQNKPVTVHKVFHSGIAAQEGSIRQGDRVLSINGTALSGFAHWEVLRVLRRAKAREMGVVVVRRGDVTDAAKSEVKMSVQAPTPAQFTEEGWDMCVRLEKNDRDLGFSLEGGVGSSLGNRPLSVQKVFQGGPVDKVRPGDEIVEIEGVSMLAMRRLEAWSFIRRLPTGPVDVILRRPLKHQLT